MDLDFENLTGNSTFEPDTEYYIHRYLSTELPTFIIAIAASFTNALIIYMVYKFRVLRTRTYHYVVCWCICNLFATISLPSSFNLFGMLYHFSAELLCLWSETLFVFIFGNQIFVGILMLDWYIMTFSSQTSCALRCRKSQKTIIVSVWIVLLTFADHNYHVSTRYQLPILGAGGLLQLRNITGISYVHLCGKIS